MKTLAEQTDEVLTKPQIAARLNVTTRTIESWMSKRLIPYRKIGRTVRFVWGEALEHFVLCTPEPQAPKAPAQLGPGIASSLAERAKQIRRAEAKVARSARVSPD